MLLVLVLNSYCSLMTLPLLSSKLKPKHSRISMFLFPSSKYSISTDK